MRVRIEKIVSQGDGLARVGKDIFFVPGVLPGEEVEVAAVSRKKNVVYCELTHIITPSQKRIEPVCPHYGVCGGCNLQITTAEEGVKIKEEIVLENLKRIGKVDLSTVFIDPPLLSSPVGYRQRVRFQVDTAKKRIGFYAKKSHEVVDISFCPLLVPALNILLGERKDALFKAASKRKGRDGIVTLPALAGSDGMVSLDDTPVRISIGKRELKASAEVFFQNNMIILEQMIPLIQSYAQGTRMVDLFSGVGTFAAFLESEAAETVAVEKHPACLTFARDNLQHTTFFTDEVESWGKRNGEETVDTVVVDPPRSGLSPVAHQAITAMKPEVIVYVSCDSATFSRDIQLLAGQGYRLERLTFADMYPQTSHTETVALVRRIS